MVINKDGSFQRSARFRGPELDSGAAAELVAAAGRLNNALRRLSSGWAAFVEAQRNPAALYPASVFPDGASALVEAERRSDFLEAGAHFESVYFLTFVWLPPAEAAGAAENWLYEAMQDWTLQSLIVDWRSGEIRLRVHSPNGQADICASGLADLRFPRAYPWGPSSSINTVEGPTPLQNGLLHLKIEMQSGDLIEIIARSFEMPTSVRNAG